MAEDNKYNILIECGADFVLPFDWYDNNGMPYDLTGATVTAQLREHAGAPVEYEFVCTHNGTGGRIVISLPSEVTTLISFSYGVYDVFVDLASGRKRPLHGDVTVQDHVTRLIDGSFLYMVGVEKYRDLPTVGKLNRLYFCYEDRKIYRWNGKNYIATSVGNGIQKIEKIRTDGVLDYYRMTFDDGTLYEYVVTNGRSVTSVVKLKSEELVDTYRMYFNDGTYWDYSITNGGIAYAAFEVDLNTGCLIVTVPDHLQTPDFLVNQITGQMEVIVS